MHMFLEIIPWFTVFFYINERINNYLYLIAFEYA